MALGGEVHHRARLVLGEQALDQCAVADVAMHEEVARVAFQRRERLAVAGVGQCVEVDHRLVAGREPVEHEVRADEAGAACHENHSGNPA